MTAIEATFLGTTASIPTKYRNHPAVYIKYRGKEESCVLFDCGEGTQRQIFTAGLNFMRLDNVFITHWHADHFAGLLGLAGTMNLEGREKPLNVYGPEADKFVAVMSELGYWQQGFVIRGIDVPYKGTDIAKIHDDDEFEVLAAPAAHSIPAVAYALREKDRIKIDTEKARDLGLPKQGVIYKQLKEKGSATFRGRHIELSELSVVEPGKCVVYTGDTLPSKIIVKLAMNCHLLIHDCTYLDDAEKTSRHSNIREAMEVAAEAHAKRLVLTHISRRYVDVSDVVEQLKAHPNVLLAKDFMTVTV